MSLQQLSVTGGVCSVLRELDGAQTAIAGDIWGEMEGVHGTGLVWAQAYVSDALSITALSRQGGG